MGYVEIPERTLRVLEEDDRSSNSTLNTFIIRDLDEEIEYRLHAVNERERLSKKLYGKVV